MVERQLDSLAQGRLPQLTTAASPAFPAGRHGCTKEGGASGAAGNGRRFADAIAAAGSSSGSGGDAIERSGSDDAGEGTSSHEDETHEEETNVVDSEPNAAATTTMTTATTTAVLDDASGVTPLEDAAPALQDDAEGKQQPQEEEQQQQQSVAEAVVAGSEEAVFAASGDGEDVGQSEPAHQQPIGHEQLFARFDALVAAASRPDAAAASAVSAGGGSSATRTTTREQSLAEAQAVLEAISLLVGGGNNNTHHHQTPHQVPRAVVVSLSWRRAQLLIKQSKSLPVGERLALLARAHLDAETAHAAAREEAGVVAPAMCDNAHVLLWHGIAVVEYRLPNGARGVRWLRGAGRGPRGSGGCSCGRRIVSCRAVPSGRNVSR
jgi:hypothetical protein